MKLLTFRRCAIILPWQTKGFWSEEWTACFHLSVEEVRLENVLKNHMTLTFHASNVLLRNILQTTRRKLESEIVDKQTGKTKGTWPKDQIVSLRILKEKAYG